MRVKAAILIPAGLLLVGGGIAVGRYLVPESSSAAAQSTASTTTSTQLAPTTTSTSAATTTTTTTAPQGPTPGIYDIAGSTPTSPHLFLVVQQVKPTALLPTGGVNIDVSFQSQDGSTQSLDQLIGTATAGHLTLTSQTNPGEGKYQGSQDGKVSGSYGTFQGVTSIFFGGGMCGKWGGPSAIQACNFVLRPASSSPTTTTGAPLTLPGMVTCQQGASPVRRPSIISIGCATGDSWVASIMWTSWTTTAAHGTGILHWDTCTPDCAAANYVTYNRTSVTLSSPVTRSGNLVFSGLLITAPGKSATNALHQTGDEGSGWG